MASSRIARLRTGAVVRQVSLTRVLAVTIMVLALSLMVVSGLGGWAYLQNSHQNGRIDRQDARLNEQQVALDRLQTQLSTLQLEVRAR